MSNPRILAMKVSHFCLRHDLPVSTDPKLTKKQRDAVYMGSPSITLSTLARLEALAAAAGAPSLLATFSTPSSHKVVAP